MAKIDIWVDGSCEPNPGVGEWAAILKSNGHRKEISGRVPGESTNNIAELMAVIYALVALKGGPHEITIYTDSQYVARAVYGIKRPTANIGLLEQIRTLVDSHEVTVEMVEAHSGNRENERADWLAKRAVKGRERYE